jgi:hypothetical protein
MQNLKIPPKQKETHEFYVVFHISKFKIQNKRQPLNVLHELKVGSLSLDFFDTAWSQLVDKITENHSILQNIFDRTIGQRLSEHGADPACNFRFQFLISLSLLISIEIPSSTRNHNHENKQTKQTKLYYILSQKIYPLRPIFLIRSLIYSFPPIQENVYQLKTYCH